jgi:hypothetical protein
VSLCVARFVAASAPNTALLRLMRGGRPPTPGTAAGTCAASARARWCGCQCWRVAVRARVWAWWCDAEAAHRRVQVPVCLPLHALPLCNLPAPAAPALSLCPPRSGCTRSRCTGWSPAQRPSETCTRWARSASTCAHVCVCMCVCMCVCARVCVCVCVCVLWGGGCVGVHGVHVGLCLTPCPAWPTHNHTHTHMHTTQAQPLPKHTRASAHTLRKYLNALRLPPGCMMRVKPSSGLACPGNSGPKAILWITWLMLVRCGRRCPVSICMCVWQTCVYERQRERERGARVCERRVCVAGVYNKCPRLQREPCD